MDATRAVCVIKRERERVDTLVSKDMTKREECVQTLSHCSMLTLLTILPVTPMPLRMVTFKITYKN